MDIIICGIGGKMGGITAASAKAAGIPVVAGIDSCGAAGYPFPVYPSFEQCAEQCAAIIDFSRPEALSDILGYCTKTGAAAVLCSTGYTAAQLGDIEKAAKRIPIFRSANMSVGVAVLRRLVRRAAAELKGFDIEIIEKHHNRKVDAPSGTALLLADACKSELPHKVYTYGRGGTDCKRKSDELGIHAVRGGTVCGEHDVLFLGNDEIVTLSHAALSRTVFAEGALKAAAFLAQQKPGKIYDMDDMLSDI